MTDIIERFVRRLKRIGIDVTLSLNVPWVYLDSVNGMKVVERFHAEHGFTAFWWPVRMDQKIVFTDRRKVFAKVREMAEMDSEGEEHMSITLTCGHTVNDFDDINYLALASFTREHNRCVDYVNYCDECTEKALERGEVLLTVDDEDVWLQSRSAKLKEKNT